ncbi:helix-turn-helix domain-containing protein [Demequina sp. NBRC 110052]|uniref:helix-turn-helix domain-containing protein n=1 Tax=Demequina sp. NBRC 110052 TaxID=1570341 RepID=UPI000A05A489|nr:XRE family transcriptional regulator [Demequina sp. NBRC 110052]
MDELAQISARLRAARQTRGWTLEDLASRAHISTSTLSRLESGKRQATLELLLPLTRELGIRIDDLVPSQDPDPRVHRREIRRDGVTLVSLAPASSRLRAYEIAYAPAAQPPASRTHEGREWLYVLDGELRLILGDREMCLMPGEAAEFDTLVPHSMSATGSREARILSIFSAEGERLHTHVEDTPAS